ncbi:MAG: hypothetical protein ABI473_04535 [Candidatus Dormibacter sp.]
MTRLLTRSDIERVLEVDAALAVLYAGFASDTDAAVPGQRIRTDLPASGTASALLPGLLPGIPAYTVKVNAKFAAARPAWRGVPP